MLLATACYVGAIPDQQNIEASRLRLDGMIQAIEQLQAQLLPNFIFLVADETTFLLDYYLGKRHDISPRQSVKDFRDWRIGSLHCDSSRWAYSNLNDVRTDLAGLRASKRLPPQQRLWVLDGGFEISSSSSPSAQFLSNTLVFLPIKDHGSQKQWPIVRPVAA